MFSDNNGPQPPKILNGVLEINSSLRTLMQNNAPLKIRFNGREQRYLSYLVAVDRENQSLALDELVPSGAEKFLQAGEEFHVEAQIDGVRVNWTHSQAAISGKINSHSCYWLRFPAEMRHHQRRGTFRANVLPDQPASITLAGAGLDIPVTGRLLDISATGCKVHIDDAQTGLQAGQLYDNCTLEMPFGSLALTIEARHVQSFDESNISRAGLRFHQMDGITQRNIERYVNQLQREARRTEGGDLF